ncbi:MAG: polyphosphate:AMP phosphotransferase [Xanthomonadales bacterium]|nr:polyphosphate:AMP phosphotransferase [Xanthomonadales bacterium]
MFQAAELGQAVSDREFKDREPDIWHRLLMQQQRLRRQADSAVLVDFAGVRGAGKSECTNLLNKWMDARWIHTHGFDPEVERERVRPRMWRYWMRLAPRGQIGLYLSGRYSPLLLDRVFERIDHEAFELRIRRINVFEKMLADDGMLVLKYWMHISKALQKERLQRIEQDPDHHWRVTETHWKHWALYDRFIEVAEQIISLTNTGHAPWEIVEASDPNYRALHVGASLHDQMDRHMTRVELHGKFREELNQQLDNGNGAGPAGPVKTVFDSLDFTKTLEKDDYQEQLEHYQSRLSRLQHRAQEKKLSTILVFEGPDASGKGGAIRRITNCLDARYFKVHPFAAPTDEESQHHYLWRFWRCIPRDGRLSIFDRSWYGRVLVERVEGLASDGEWRRAYREINAFEYELVDHGIVFLKFWIHVNEDEQLARFNKRQKTPHKQWKQTDEDWRNREKWHEYTAAAHDAIKLTDTQSCPWVLVEGNSKQRARIKVLQEVCRALEATLNEPA